MGVKASGRITLISGKFVFTALIKGATSTELDTGGRIVLFMSTSPAGSPEQGVEVAAVLDDALVEQGLQDQSGVKADMFSPDKGDPERAAFDNVARFDDGDILGCTI